MDEKVYGYRYYYNEVTKRYTYDNFLSEFHSNGRRKTEGWLRKKDRIEEKVAEMNAKLDAGELIPCRCVECGRTYMLAASEETFYRAKKLALPTRCIPCRKKNSKRHEKHEHTIA